MVRSSSTSSSEPGLPDAPLLSGGFPWALAGAVLILLAVEAAVRLADPADVIPYSAGREEHFAVANYLSRFGPADVGFIGSSMTREGIAAPLVRARLEQAVDAPFYVANYGCGGMVADEGNAIVRYMVRNRKIPRLLMYEVNLQHLRPSVSSQAGLLAVFWDVKDWFQEWARTGTPRMRELPVVIRRDIGRWWLTLRYRDRVSEWSREWLRLARSVPVPIQGEYSKLLGFNTHLSANPAKRQFLLRKWLDGPLRNGRYPKMDRAMVEYLEDTLRLCRDNQIALVLYEMPVWPGVQARIPSETYEEFYRVVDGLSDKCQVPFYRVADLQVTLGDEHFIDVTHMNRHGAAVMTGALIDKAILPRMAATSASGLAGLTR
ncbi:MAG: hypothetical protein ABSH20_01390 [Tepidisphaeraceae bacterium]|jgi:hypothetical protein